MKAGKTASRWLSVALCALLALLVLKLTLTIAGALQSGHETTSAVVPEAMAKEKKPAAQVAKVKNTAPVKTEARVSPDDSTTMYLSVFQRKEIEMRKREEQLNEKEQRLNKLKQEVEQKVKYLLALQKQIQSVQNEKQETQNAKVRSLAKIYGTMKPKEAAKLMENLDDNLVMDIISTMTPNQAAGILALMDVKKAAKISEALSGQ